MKNNYKLAYNVSLNTNDFLTQCNDKDVISINSNQWIGMHKLKNDVTNAFKYSDGLSSIRNSITSYSGLNTSKDLFEGGQECEILKAGSQGWQKGKLKIKVTLEFIPDEPEVESSPLDDIRQTKINL